MKVYIVQVIPEASLGKVSQEGYSTLEKAQAFVESRSDRPSAANLAVPLPHGRLHRLPHLRGQYRLRKIRPQGRFFRTDYFSTLLY